MVVVVGTRRLSNTWTSSHIGLPPMWRLCGTVPDPPVAEPQARSGAKENTSTRVGRGGCFTGVQPDAAMACPQHVGAQNERLVH